MIKFLIKFLSMSHIIQLMLDAADYLEAKANQLGKKAEKIHTKMVKKSEKYDKKVEDATKAFNEFLVATKEVVDHKLDTLSAKTARVMVEEKKARTLTKNWKKNLLEGLDQ